jgi:ABC-type nitrate/sulfonate/bicarbonate transport system ATPase subunit
MQSAGYYSIVPPDEVIFVMRDIDEAISLSDRVVVTSLQHGRTKADILVNLTLPGAIEFLTLELITHNRSCIKLHQFSIESQKFFLL